MKPILKYIVLGLAMVLLSAGTYFTLDALDVHIVQGASASTHSFSGEADTRKKSPSDFSSENASGSDSVKEESKKRKSSSSDSEESTTEGESTRQSHGTVKRTSSSGSKSSTNSTSGSTKSKLSRSSSSTNTKKKKSSIAAKSSSKASTKTESTASESTTSDSGTSSNASKKSSSKKKKVTAEDSGKTDATAKETVTEETAVKNNDASEAGGVTESTETDESLQDEEKLMTVYSITEDTVQEITVPEGDTVVIEVEGATLEGCINAENNAADISLFLDENSTFTLTADCYITSLVNADTENLNINFGEFHIYVNGEAIQ